MFKKYRHTGTDTFIDTIEVVQKCQIMHITWLYIYQGIIKSTNAFSLLLCYYRNVLNTVLLHRWFGGIIRGLTVNHFRYYFETPAQSYGIAHARKVISAAQQYTVYAWIAQCS